MSWNANEEKLLALAVLDDEVARQLFPDSAEGAFFRAFVVEDRKTGKVSMKYRFNWAERGRSWWKMDFTKWDRETMLPKIEEILSMMVTISAIRMDLPPITGDAIQIFEPPDDGGDGTQTIQWLADRDLIEVKIFEVPDESVN